MRKPYDPAEEGLIDGAIVWRRGSGRQGADREVGKILKMRLKQGRSGQHKLHWTAQVYWPTLDKALSMPLAKIQTLNSMWTQVQRLADIAGNQKPFDRSSFSDLDSSTF